MSTFWLRFVGESTFTNTPGSTDNTTRLRFYANDCFFNQNCLPPGRYTANVLYSAAAWERRRRSPCP